MPKTFYDKNENELGTFYTKTETDALIPAPVTVPHLYMHKITIHDDCASHGSFLGNNSFKFSIYNSSNVAFTWTSFKNYLYQGHNLVGNVKGYYDDEPVLTNIAVAGEYYDDSDGEYIQKVAVQDGSTEYHIYGYNNNVYFNDTIETIF